MSEANVLCDTTVEDKVVVLLARIVDRDGCSIQRADVAAIEYSIYEVNPRWSGEATIVGGLEAVAIDVDEVFFDSPQNGGGWTVDEMGYNFRHEVALGEDVVSPEAAARIEVRYVLTPATGEMTIVRFQLTV